MDFDATANDVISVLRPCGPLLKWFFPRKDPKAKMFGKHKGYGFVYFKSFAGYRQCCKMAKDPPYVKARKLMINLNKASNNKVLRQYNGFDWDKIEKLGGFNEPEQELPWQDQN